MRTGWQRPGRVRVVTGATGRTYARTEERTVDERKDIGQGLVVYKVCCGGCCVQGKLWG